MSRAGIAVAAIAPVLLLAPVVPAQAAAKDGGSLKVVASGVPTGRSAKIVVSGKKYRKKLPSAGKLRNLRPGVYRVWASPIVADGGTAAVPNLPLQVKVRKRAKSTLRLSYTWNPRNDSYPPSPAANLELTDRTLSSVSLAWDNGIAPDLQGVEVRRKQGAVAPAALDDGRYVSVSDKSNHVTDEGLRPNTVYSYSVFMVDTAGNASAATSITVRTKGQALAVASGLWHTCALLVDPRAAPDDASGSNQVACWGGNGKGQVGDGTTRDALSPHTVDLDSPVKVVAGGNHTCALLQAGTLWCWGDNEHGQLGDGTTDASTTPVRAVVSGVKDVAAGFEHTCVLRVNGSVECWGANQSGQLGVAASEAEPAPVKVRDLPKAQSLAAGFAHTCAVVDAGVRCWGGNDHGQLGDRSSVDSYTPVIVSGLSAVQSISAGVGHTCAVSDDVLRCWGDNEQGQLGDGTRTDHNAPVPTGIKDVSAVSAGAYHTCAIASGQLRCWGRNGTGRIGDGTTTDRLLPVRVSGQQAPTSIAAGGYHSCAVSDAGTACWGAGGRGQIGTGEAGDTLRPLAVDGL